MKRIIRFTTISVIPLFFGISEILPSYALAGDDNSSKFTETEKEAVEQGWLDPDTRRDFQLFNLFFSAVLLMLTGASLYLRRKLKEKVISLEKTQEKIAEQNKLLRLITENTIEGIWDFNVEKKTGTMSRQWYARFGYEPRKDDILLSEWNSFIHPDDLPTSQDAFSNFIQSGGRGQYDSEFRIRRADGTWCWTLSRGRTVAWDVNGRPLRIIGLHLDIQKTKDAQTTIHQKEENFRKLFKYAPVPLVISSEQGTVIDVNDRMTALLGYTADDIQSIDRWWLLAYPDPVYREELKTKWQSAVEKAALSGSSVAPQECRVTCKDATERIMSIEATIIGKNLLISLYDLTDRKKAEDEREKLREQLLQSQKLEAIGVLAGGVAHDFNNMIGAIMGYSELLIDEMEADNPHRRYQESILEAAHRSADLTRQLLAFARKQSAAPIVLDLNQAVESMLKLLHRLIGENIKLVWLPGKNPCRIKIDPSQLDQILANLCVNARDAITGVGNIAIETDNVTVSPADSDIHPDSKPGTFAMLSVSDNGVGMEEETVHRIFEPFFTTKEPGRGTGMGLATVYGIIKQNGGFVNVYSKHGQGTTFKLYFPTVSEAPAEKPAEGDKTIPRARGETILLVEDDIALLEMTRIILEKLGYKVLAAETPNKAISMARSFNGPIDLFITDVIMPEMNGRELADLLPAIRPGIRHLYMSGYTANVIADQGGLMNEGVHFLQKPFSERELAMKVRNVLE